MKRAIPAEVVKAFIERLGVPVTDEIVSALEAVYSEGARAEKQHIFDMFKDYATQHQDAQVRHTISNALCMLI